MRSAGGGGGGGVGGLSLIVSDWLKCIRTFQDIKLARTLSMKKMSLMVGLHSSDRILIGLYAAFIRNTVGNAGGHAREPHVCRYHNKKWTVLSSPFIHKKARSQFELRTYSRIVEIFGIGSTTAKFLSWYIVRNSPPEVRIQIKSY